MLHTLVSEARDGMTPAAVAVACQRDPEKPEDLEEVEAALRLLLEDGLAEHEGDQPRESGHADRLDRTAEAPQTQTQTQTLYRPTRAAIRAHELSF